MHWHFGLNRAPNGPDGDPNDQNVDSKGQNRTQIISPNNRKETQIFPNLQLKTCTINSKSDVVSENCNNHFNNAKTYK